MLSAAFTVSDVYKFPNFRKLNNGGDKLALSHHFLNLNGLTDASNK